MTRLTVNGMNEWKIEEGGPRSQRLTLSRVQTLCALLRFCSTCVAAAVILISSPCLREQLGHHGGPRVLSWKRGDTILALRHALTPCDDVRDGIALFSTYGAGRCVSFGDDSFVPFVVLSVAHEVDHLFREGSQAGGHAKQPFYGVHISFNFTCSCRLRYHEYNERGGLQLWLRRRLGSNLVVCCPFLLAPVSLSRHRVLRANM